MKKGFKIIDIAYIGMAVALIESCKTALLFLPNVELTSFWLIIFAIFMGWKALLIIPVFIAIEAALYGPHVWVIMYLYVWPILTVLGIFRIVLRCAVLARPGHFFGKSKNTGGRNQSRHKLVDLRNPV